MNKLLLALIALSAGAGVVHTARQSTLRLEQEAKVLRDEWLVHSQTVASAQTELAGVNERIRELKLVLAAPLAAADNALWSALQTNRADRLPLELRTQVREELGFHWRFSPDYIVVSKQALRDLGMITISDGKLTDTGATVLALTPEERGQVEAAMQRVQTDFKDWALAHVERSEPKDDMVAHYALPADPATFQSISNSFANGLIGAIGKERAELVLPSAASWMGYRLGFLSESGELPVAMTVKRYMDGNESRLRGQISYGTWRGDGGRPFDLSQHSSFPAAFRVIFPNGWADVAKREGFTLPEEFQKQ